MTLSLHSKVTFYSFPDKLNLTLFITKIDGDLLGLGPEKNLITHWVHKKRLKDNKDEN